MDEAYTIGIKLALEDGVSTGIALIGRDLDKLEGAIGQTTTGLVRLADAARSTLAGAAASARMPQARAVAAIETPEAESVPRAVAPAPAPHTKEIAVVRTPAQEAEENVAAPIRAQAPPPAAASAPVIRVAAEQATAASPRVPEAAPTSALQKPPMLATVASERASPERPAAVAAAAAAKSMPAEPASAAPLRVPLPQERPVAASADAVRRATSEVSPVALTLRGDHPAPSGSTAPTSTARLVIASAPAATVAGAANGTELESARLSRAPASVGAVRIATTVPPQARRPSLSAAPLQKVPLQAVEPDRRASPPPEMPAARAVPRSGAVPAASPPRSPAAPPVAAAPVARQATPAPAPASTEPERSESNVYLDGDLVGRWLVERLGRDASRPPTGTTGIDGRLSPAWFPGALQ